MKRNFLFIFLTVLLSLLITAVAAMVTLYGAQSQSTAETLKSDTAIYADLVKNEGYEVLDSIKSFGIKRVTVIDNDGDALFESDKYSDMENHLYREEVQAALNGKPSVTSRYSETAKRQNTAISLNIFCQYLAQTKIWQQFLSKKRHKIDCPAKRLLDNPAVMVIRKQPGARLFHRHIVFYSATAQASVIKAGFYSNDIAGL